MLTLGRKLFSKVIAGTTLVAALVLAVLPLGQMPKVAGPCGRTLCLCIEPAKLDHKSCELCPITQEPMKCSKTTTPAKSRLVLTDSPLMLAGEPVLAFYPVFNVLGIVEKTVFAVLPDEAMQASAFDRSALCSDSRVRDIHAPPPKA
jgi:hypothetical protein